MLHLPAVRVLLCRCRANDYFCMYDGAGACFMQQAERGACVLWRCVRVQTEEAAEALSVHFGSVVSLVPAVCVPCISLRGLACAWRAAARAALFKFVRGRVVAGCLLAYAHLSKSEHEGLRCLFGADRAGVC